MLRLSRVVSILAQASHILKLNPLAKQLTVFRRFHLIQSRSWWGVHAAFAGFLELVLCREVTVSVLLLKPMAPNATFSATFNFSEHKDSTTGQARHENFLYKTKKGYRVQASQDEKLGIATYFTEPPPGRRYAHRSSLIHLYITGSCF